MNLKMFCIKINPSLNALCPLPNYPSAHEDPTATGSKAGGQPKTDGGNLGRRPVSQKPQQRSNFTKEKKHFCILSKVTLPLPRRLRTVQCWQGSGLRPWLPV